MGLVARRNLFLVNLTARTVVVEVRRVVSNAHLSLNGDAALVGVNGGGGSAA